MPIILQTDHLTRTYNRGRVQALRDVSLHVSRGQIFGLLGPNGAGKTTFIKVVLGLVHSHAGAATLFDLPISDPAARRKVGYLPENHRFPGYLTAESFLSYCGRLSGMRNKNELRSRMEKVLRAVKMWEWRHTRIHKFSKGMAQRLGLAQALIHDPELIFLDEPTDGVDPIGRKEIRDMLLALKAEGKTIFLNSHLLSEVEMICDEVAILDKGRLVRQGSVEELTRVERKYRVHVEIEDGHILQQIRGLAGSLAHINGYLEIAVSDPAVLNKIIDLLRANHYLIQAVVPVKYSLEQRFMELITARNDTGAEVDTP